MHIKISLALIGSLLVGDAVQAQMFGTRRVGRPLSRRNPPGFAQAQEDVGTLQGTERFIRGNRSPADFVGPDLRELQRFIGILQATPRGTVTPAVEGLRRRVDRSEAINQPLPASPAGEMYYPQLEVNVSIAEIAPEPGSTEANVLDTLVRSPEMSGSSRIAVSMEDRTAILRGEVPSARDRDLAAVLLLFEPGISSVRNELVVNPQLQPAEGSLQTYRDRETPRQKWTTMSHGSEEATRSRQWEPATSRSY